MTRNIAASIRARLNNRAKEANRPFHELLQYYGLERFLYRLSRSPHRDRFVLKGALMLRVWGAPGSRPTRDIDFLGYIENDIDAAEKVVREMCAAKVQDDGLSFDASSVVGERIKEGADYEGLRVRFVGWLDNARIPMQLDIGFGDVVHPAVRESEYPTILDLQAPLLRMYPRESVVAEKFQAIVYLGTVNSRMKDFYDIWLLAQRFDFSGRDLARSIARTFENRRTAIDPEPIALTPVFTAAKQTQKQWTAFVNRAGLDSAPSAIEELQETLRLFVGPVAAALAQGRDFTDFWTAPGPWKPRSP